MIPVYRKRFLSLQKEHKTLSSPIIGKFLAFIIMVKTLSDLFAANYNNSLNFESISAIIFFPILSPRH